MLTYDPDEGFWTLAPIFVKQVCGFAAVLAVAASAAIPAWGDARPNTPDPDRDATTQINPLLAPPRPAAVPVAKPAPTGNPLWGIPLSTLTATRERPIFSPSRRAAAPVVAVPAAPPPVVQPPPMVPARPSLTFVGAIAGDAEGFAIFIDASRAVVRLRTGQSRDGWVLKSVNGRQATLQKDDLVEVFTLPAPSGIPVSMAVPSLEPTRLPALVPPNAAPTQNEQLVVPGPDANFAPFIPRHAPKDGRPDGL